MRIFLISMLAAALVTARPILLAVALDLPGIVCAFIIGLVPGLTGSRVDERLERRSRHG
ncbi:hypothetical protein [Candidatus Solirubrobacter pratensis]|uniref:hypothetical protein n=1 Tax=Candidatus Solirubrobacter pratensis TaxID=1298857 RepID=UPI00041EEAAA|nr:hypothetical protein [Candidatus Solirubrobacter pratensis]